MLLRVGGGTINKYSMTTGINQSCHRQAIAHILHFFFFLVSPDIICKYVFIDIYLFNVKFPARLQGLGFPSLLQPQFLVYRNSLITIGGEREARMDGVEV